MSIQRWKPGRCGLTSPLAKSSRLSITKPVPNTRSISCPISGPK
jgi:hypothetical protein